MSGGDGAALIVAALVLPLAAALIAFAVPSIARWVGVAAGAVLLVVVVTLCGAVGAGGELVHQIGGWGAPLGIVLRADGLSCFMLLTTALVTLVVAAYGGSYFRREGAGSPAGFVPLSMLLVAGLNGLFVSGDLFNLYVTLEVLGLSAAALVALAGTPEALSGAMRYLLVTVLASLLYLLGVALLYHLGGTLDMRLLGERVAAGGVAAWTAFGLITAAMLLKSAVFPLHFWLPPAHSNAPAPVSALLSALVVKASLYVLLRVWLDVVPAGKADVGEIVGALGCAAVLWGAIQALRQDQLKLLVAYSTVSQVGYLFVPFAFSSGAAAATAWRGAVYLVLCHALAKTAMFLSVGNIQHLGGDRIRELDHVVQRLPLTMAAFAMAGITVAGLPPSGGFVAKWLILEAAVQEGRWLLAAVVLAGGLLASIYVFRVIGPAFTSGVLARRPRRVPDAMEWIAFAAALATVLLGSSAMPLIELLDAGEPLGPALESER